MARSTGRAARNSLGFAHGGSVGRSSETLSAPYNVPPEVPEMGERGSARSDPRSRGEGLVRAWQVGPNRSFRRWLPRGGKKRGALVGKTRRGKATKIMAVADRHGLPIAIGIASGQRHETKLVVETLRNRFLKPLPKRLIGDRAYDSDGLDSELKAMGIEMIAPHHPRRRSVTQDGRPLRRYKRRWHVERLFAWLQCSRRLITRFEHKAQNFLAFLKLRCLELLLRRL